MAALKHCFLSTLLATILMFSSSTAQDGTTPRNDLCQNVTCAANEKCQMVQVQCIRAPCYPQPTCVPASQSPECSPLMDCTLNCSNGRVKDANGCDTCQCRICGPEPCVGMICPYGKAKDDDGCLACDCNQPCLDFSCPEGHECRPVKNNSTGTYVGRCVQTGTTPFCQPLSCSSRCRYGSKSDSIGCPTCECRDPCQDHPCPQGQVCKLSPDDCPEGAECRDAPMPYCTDSQTTTRPATPQLSTTRGTGERGNDRKEAIRQCCASTVMSETCSTVCSTNMTLLQSNLETLSDCFQYLGNFLHCASGGRSHVNCCYQRGISESCLYLCSGNETIDISNPHSVTQCIQSSTQTVLSCFNEGLTDANVTFSSTSTPSSTTAEDVCNLAPETGRCRALYERWYYSAKDRACAMFNYGGCDGNGNNFLTKEECLARCSRTGNVCPDVQCSPSCQITIDQYGCHSCRCGNDCLSNGCPSDQQCLMMPGSCPTNETNCPLVPKCVSTPGILCETLANCTLRCPRGWMTDTRGCAICQCKDCPSVCAGMVCPYGRVKGTNGCDTCDCYNPCQTLNCSDQCRVLKNNETGSFYGECYSRPTREPNLGTRAPKPVLCNYAPDYGMSCQSNSTRWFYNQSANACTSFAFGGCQGNDNNFQSKQVCEALCKESSCPELDCRAVQNCPYGLKTNDEGCPVCQCLDPCEGTTCPVNKVCMSQKGDCTDDEVCRDPFIRMCVDSSLVPTSTAAPRTRGCPEVSCENYCIQGSEKDSIGCDTCVCRDPCKNCTANQTCQRMLMDCPANDPRCANSFIGYCVNKPDTSSTTTEATETSSTAAGLCIQCTTTQCPHGMLKDSNGCPVCQCYNPCESVNCLDNKTCQVFEYNCSIGSDCPPNIKFRGQCVETTTTVPTTPSTTERVTCPSRIRPVCPNSCPYGNAKDSNGCYTCDCDDPCKRMTCNANQICLQVPASECQDDMCWGIYKAVCKYNCTRPTNCNSLNCTHGLAKDANGCEICQCLDPCLSVSCDANQYCAVRSEYKCVGTECGFQPVGYCTVRCPSMDNCKISCEFGFAKDEFNCKMCQCYDPCTRHTCENGETCVPSKFPIYSGNPIEPTYFGFCTLCQETMTCRMNCPYGLAKNMSTECDMCRCYEPCQNVTCRSGQACTPKQQFNGRYRYVAECAETTTTVSTTTTTTTSSVSTTSTEAGSSTPVICGTVCAIYCPYGNVKDANGCPTCNCIEPCEGVSCRANQKCVVSPLGNDSYTGECTAICGPVCNKYCPYGMARDENGCELCHCNEPCQNVTCLSGQVCTPKRQSNGSNQYVAQCGPVICGPVCMIYCPYGNVKNANGCPTCNCTEPCEGVSCRANQKCVASPLGNDSYTGQCIDCPMPMCLSPCFYGTRTDEFGCQTCNCRSDPCSGYRCSDSDKVCQTRLFCPENVCTPSPVCVDRNRPCDGLQKEYKMTFGNNVAQMQQLNCDQRGRFKPIQCSEYDCWCVDENGTPTTNRSSMELNCYSGNLTKEKLKIEADVNVIQPGEGWRFKQQVSQQIANLLTIDESLVTIRKVVSGQGSIEAEVVIGSNANSDANSFQDNLRFAKSEPFDIVYDNQTYKAIILGGPSPIISTSVTPPPTTPLPTDVSPTTTPLLAPGSPTTSSGSTDKMAPAAAKGNLLMIVLVCVFVPIAFVAIIATIWFACKIIKDERMIPARRLSHKSGISTEVDSLESGSDKVFPNDEFSSTNKDEKIPEVIDTTEA